jgi:hypothetical protein
LAASVVVTAVSANRPTAGDHHHGALAAGVADQMIPRGRRQVKAGIIALAMVVLSVGLAWWRH